MTKEQPPNPEDAGDVRQRAWEIYADPNISLDMITPEIMEALMEGWAHINSERAKERGSVTSGDDISRGKATLFYGETGRPGLIERISSSARNTYSENEIEAKLESMAEEIISQQRS